MKNIVLAVACVAIGSAALAQTAKQEKDAVGRLTYVDGLVLKASSEIERGREEHLLDADGHALKAQALIKQAEAELRAAIDSAKSAH